jgi:hypothetical protein
MGRRTRCRLRYLRWREISTAALDKAVFGVELGDKVSAMTGGFVPSGLFQGAEAAKTSRPILYEGTRKADQRGGRTAPAPGAVPLHPLIR